MYFSVSQSYNTGTEFLELTFASLQIYNRVLSQYEHMKRDPRIGGKGRGDVDFRMPWIITYHSGLLFKLINSSSYGISFSSSTRSTRWEKGHAPSCPFCPSVLPSLMVCAFTKTLNAVIMNPKPLTERLSLAKSHGFTPTPLARFTWTAAAGKKLLTSLQLLLACVKLFKSTKLFTSSV